jgi:hypothetical protein
MQGAFHFLCKFIVPRLSGEKNENVENREKGYSEKD